MRKYQKLSPFNRKTVFYLLESISSRQGEWKVEDGKRKAEGILSVVKKIDGIFRCVQ